MPHSRGTLSVSVAQHLEHVKGSEEQSPRQRGSVCLDGSTSFDEGIASLNLASVFVNQALTKNEQDLQTMEVMKSLNACLVIMQQQFEKAKEGEGPLVEQIPALKVYATAFSAIHKALDFFTSHNKKDESKPKPVSVGPSPLQSLLTRLVTEEANFLYGLEQVIQFYQTSFRDGGMISSTDESVIFSRCDKLFDLHKKLLDDMKEALRQPTQTPSIGDIFLRYRGEFEVYKSFIVNLKEAQSCLERVSKEKSVSSFLKQHEKNGLTLAELLRAPICRIEDYLVILTEFHHIESVHSSAARTAEAIEMLSGLLDSIDEQGSVADNLSTVMEIGNRIEGLDENLVRPDRRYIHDGPVKLCPMGVKKAVADYLYLFNDVLLFCQGSSKSSTYVGRFYMHRVQLVDSTDKDSNDVVLAVDERNKFIITVNDSAKRREWVVNLRKVILEVEKTRKVFGVPLSTLVKRDPDSDIPPIVEKTIHFIYEYGINKEGIFRQTGRATQIEKLKDQLNQGSNVFFSENMDVHSVADLFKLWLRELPEPLLTWDAYQPFMETIGIEDKQEQMDAMKAVIHGLPRVNIHSIQHMFKCLRAICDNETKSKMNPNNLAVVFAPNILKNPDPNADPFDQSYYTNINIVFVTLLDNYEYIFAVTEKSRAKLKLREKKKRKSTERRKSLRSTSLKNMDKNFQNVSHEGQVTVLLKKKWVSRYVVLDASGVRVKKSPKDKKGRKFLFIPNTQVVPASGCEKAFSVSFPVTEEDGTRMDFFIAAKNSDQQEDWLTSIRSALLCCADA